MIITFNFLVSFALPQSGKLTRKTVEYVPALLKIFDEILVNALDQKARSPETCTIMRRQNAQGFGEGGWW